jgi:hypothetical protein
MHFRVGDLIMVITFKLVCLFKKGTFQVTGQVRQTTKNFLVNAKSVCIWKNNLLVMTTTNISNLFILKLLIKVEKLEN